MSAAGPLRNRIEGIVVGTSAGGVEALSLLLPALPANLEAAVFIVMHLPRGKPSLLVEIFSSRCALPVREPEDKEPVRPGTVYVAPPDYHLLLDRGAAPPGVAQIALSTDEPVRYSRPSIDVLFESAAELYGRRLMGVLLTGANEDGAAGMDAVQRAGGVTVVQSPEEAYASFMPASALKAGPVDHVLSLEGIAGLLRTLGAAEANRIDGGGGPTGGR